MRAISSGDGGLLWLQGKHRAQSIQAFGITRRKSIRYREQHPEQVEEYLQQIADVFADFMVTDMLAYAAERLYGADQGQKKMKFEQAELVKRGYHMACNSRHTDDIYSPTCTVKNAPQAPINQCIIEEPRFLAVLAYGASGNIGLFQETQ